MKKLMILTAAALVAGFTFAEEAPAAAPADTQKPAAELEDTASHWWMPSIWYGATFETASQGRGKIFEDRPCMENEFDISFSLGDYGRIGVYHWDTISFTGRCHEDYRRCFNEVDWGAYYAYDLGITQDITLSTQVMAYWMLYYGGRGEDSEGPSDFEWDLAQSLNTPWITPFWTLRCGLREPGEWFFADLGVKHAFDLGHGFTFTPRIDFYLGNSGMFYIRTGQVCDHRCGLMVIQPSFRLDYAICDHLSVFAKIAQFVTTDDALREAYKAPHRRDVTIFSCGFELNF